MSTSLFISCLITAVICSLVFYQMGLHNGRLQSPRQAELKGPQPVCGCTHHISYHDPKTGQCHEYQAGVVERDVKTGETTMIQCKCRRYAGPQPLDEYYAPEIAGEA